MYKSTKEIIKSDGSAIKIAVQKVIFNELIHCYDSKLNPKLTCKFDKHF